MLRKSRRQLLLEIAADYIKSFGPEFEIPALVDWAIKKGLYKPSKTAHQLGVSEFKKALKNEKDEDGCRLYLNVEVEQRTLWGHRHDATWQVRQKFIKDQVARAEADVRSVQKLCDKLNQERSEDETEFQCRFEWE